MLLNISSLKLLNLEEIFVELKVSLSFSLSKVIFEESNFSFLIEIIGSKSLEDSFSFSLIILTIFFKL